MPSSGRPSIDHLRKEPTERNAAKDASSRAAWCVPPLCVPLFALERNGVVFVESEV